MSVWWFVGAALLVVAVSAYMQGRVDGAAGPKAELRRLKEAARLQAEQHEKALQRLLAKQAELVKRKQALQKEVERVAAKPEYRRECLDADGVRVVNDAIAAGAAGTAGTVCKADPVAGWECGGGPSQAGGDDPTVE